MEPNISPIARAEAQRWLGIAEKLLTTRDLVGSKTFAIRARESDPRLEPAEQILAVVDTLIAGEKRINNQFDWYAILQLVRQTHDSELIAAQYRRLAILLNPHKNRLPFADHAFKLVSDAWSVLSNPPRRALYDNDVNFQPKIPPVGLSREQEYHEPAPAAPQNKHPQPQPPAAVRQIPREQLSDIEEDSTINSNHDDGASSFWTACPYCYNMYEYPRVYEECTLRCQNCRRAFQGVIIPAPPPIFDGKEAYFCCWGFFPLGVSMSNFQKNKGGVGGSNWTPFSPMFTCPESVVGTKKGNVRKNTGPRIYIDDDQDVFMEISESSDDSDDDWGSSKRKKKGKSVKGKGAAGKNVKQAKNVKGGSSGGGNVQGGFIMQEGVAVAPSVSVAETSKKAVGSNARRPSGRVVRELGKLDLNVEFSNEVEEPAPGISEGNGAGNREGDNIEGIEFFEGLDEFLSSLPILSVVGDDKVKAA